MKIKPINIIFDGPPGAIPGRFVEVENDEGASIRVGVWHERTRPDFGVSEWILRITELEALDAD